MVIKLNQAESFSQPGVEGHKYHINELVQNRIFVTGKLEGEHGERTSTDTPRLYYVIEGEGRVQIKDQTLPVGAGDLIVIPPNTTYNYWSQNGPLKFILFMETH